TSGSSNYIQNTTNQQSSSNFNVSGDGTAGGTLSANVINATSQYNIGGNRVFSVAGEDNVFAGVSAGQSNTTGCCNTFFGNTAGQANTTGFRNSFFGDSAGNKNTGGQSNSFFGNLAGFRNTTGFENSFFGDSSGFAKTSEQTI